MSALNEMDALVFSSRVDNYPLILCEALSIGVPVIATHSEAAQEVLAKSGGQTFAATDVLRLAQRRKPEIAQAVFGATLDAFRMRSRVAYSGQQMLEGMSRSIRICSYLLLPLIYLLVNVKIAQLGKAFPLPSSLFYRCCCCYLWNALA